MSTILVEPPFRVDYGNNIEFKGWFYANFNLTILGKFSRVERAHSRLTNLTDMARIAALPAGR